MTDRALNGRVAVVTGASRGIGRGIALELGAAGATVYVTGRSIAETDSPVGGTITETANEVSEAGGLGIAVQCDHTDDRQVEALFDRVRADQGRLDILVNNATSAQSQARWMVQPIWEQDPDVWTDVIDAGVRMHYIATVYGTRLMIEDDGGLIANVSSLAGASYLHSVVYGMGKAATDRLSNDSAQELRPYGVAAVSLWPGMVLTESFELLTSSMGIELAGAAEHMETPRFTGRALVALATDPDVMKRTGQALIVAEIAKEYGFTDVRGNQPPVIADAETLDRLSGFAVGAAGIRTE